MPLPHDLKILCDRERLTLAVAESASAGRLSALIAGVSGSSSYFQGGVVAYSLQQKVEVLGVDGTHAATVNCVSDQVAREMASGVRRLFGTDIGLSVTGYAEPSWSGKAYAWLGFDVRGLVWTERVEYAAVAGVHVEALRQDAQRFYAWMTVGRLVDHLNERAPS